MSTAPLPAPRLGTLTGGFGRWVVLHKGSQADYKTKTRAGDVVIRPGSPLPEVLELVAELGYDSVSICAWLGHTAYPYSLSPRVRTAIREQLDSTGLHLAGLSAAAGGRHNFDRFGYTTPDADEIAERLAYARSCIELAADLGASHVEDVVGMPHPSVSADEAWSRVVDHVGALHAYAAERGVAYAVEPYMGVVNTPQRFLDLRAAVGDLGCVIDPVSLLAEEEITAVAIAERLGGYARGVHIKGLSAEGRMTRPGSASDTFEIAEFWAALFAAGYAGELTFEEYPDSYPEPLDPRDSARDALRDVRAKLEVAR